jgi:hypothetical protein
MHAMSIEGAIRKLNHLKQRHALRDYALFGAVATFAYMEPTVTRDVDVLVLVDADEEFWSVYRRVRGIGEGVVQDAILLDGTPVQLFPTTLGSLHRDAVLQGKRVRIGPVRTKVVPVEHLVLLLLQAYRPKDRIRVVELLPVANEPVLQDLFQRFDDEQKTLAKRFQTLRRVSF